MNVYILGEATQMKNVADEGAVVYMIPDTMSIVWLGIIVTSFTISSSFSFLLGMMFAFNDNLPTVLSIYAIVIFGICLPFGMMLLSVIKLARRFMSK